jgi:hypothetical protein
MTTINLASNRKKLYLEENYGIKVFRYEKKRPEKIYPYIKYLKKKYQQKMRRMNRIRRRLHRKWTNKNSKLETQTIQEWRYLINDMEQISTDIQVQERIYHKEIDISDMTRREIKDLLEELQSKRIREKIRELNSTVETIRINSNLANYDYNQESDYDQEIDNFHESEGDSIQSPVYID